MLQEHSTRRGRKIIAHVNERLDPPKFARCRT